MSHAPQPPAEQVRDFGALDAKDGALETAPVRPVRLDPLAELRRPGDPAIDILCVGPVFFDIVFTGLSDPPPVGVETWAPGMGSSPGGTANMAVAMRRLGLRTALASAFGDDLYADYCWDTLGAQEGIDLSASRRYENWHSPVTVSLAAGRGRTMISHGHPPPQSIDELVGLPPASRACFLGCEREPQQWVRKARDSGALVFADVGWDDAEDWPARISEQFALCDVFLPNAAEAQALTGADDPDAALRRLAESVPVVVVTRGRHGALAIDQRTGEQAAVNGLHVEAIDATGAGDVFGAAFTVGTLAGWPLPERLRFANLCAALSVQQFGGSLAAPGWGEITAWARERLSSDVPAELLDYRFVLDLLPDVALDPVHRAAATLRRRPL